MGLEWRSVRPVKKSAYKWMPVWIESIQCEQDENMPVERRILNVNGRAAEPHSGP